MQYNIRLKDDGTVELSGSLMVAKGVVVAMPQYELKTHLSDQTYKAYLLALSRFDSMESRVEWLEDLPNFRNLIIGLGCSGVHIADEDGSRWIHIF